MEGFGRFENGELRGDSGRWERFNLLRFSYLPTGYKHTPVEPTKNA